MEILNVLLDPIFPVSAIILLGYFMGRAGKISTDDARLINRLSMTVFLPVLIFGLLANAPIHSFSILPIVIYAAVEAIVFTGGYLLAARVFKRDASEAVLLAFCGIFANNAFFVLPISVLLYGQDGVLPIMAILTLDSIVTFAGTMIALQIINLGRITPGAIALNMVKTPVLVAIVLGVFFGLAQISIPAPVQTFIDFNGAAAAPIALYALGVVLSRTPFRFDPMIVTFSSIKLIVFPLAFWAGLVAFVPPHPELDKFLLSSAGPAGTMAFSLALLHGVRTDAIAQIIIWTSVLTLFSLAFLA